ncbi:MAG: hypothetical protein Q8K30_05875 [Candidatus Gracilibacteria bacterium]|nr:hypothetical protein [Candidatus Gracilibacteria bacterium]
MKKILLVLLSVFLLFSCSGNTQNLSNTGINSLDVINPDADYVYYYGITCPHCVNVTDYFSENDIMNKYKIEKREVWENDDNYKIFEVVLSDLGIADEKKGVPFMYRKSDKKYFSGDKEIIEYFDKNIIK